MPVDLRVAADPRQHVCAEPEAPQQIGIPLQLTDVHQGGARRVGYIRDKDAACVRDSMALSWRAVRRAARRLALASASGKATGQEAGMHMQSATEAWL